MEKNYLGIDWGSEKVGLALAHAETGVALPWGVLPNDSALLEKLQALIESEAVGTVVIGISKRRSENAREDAGEIFGKRLQEKGRARVVYADEMFTTKLAQEKMKKLGGRHVSQNDDAEAAAILLQGWLGQKER